MHNPSTVSVLVVEPDLPVQRSIRDASAHPSVRFVGFVRRPAAALALARTAFPDVIVYDPVGASATDATEALESLRRESGGAAVVLFGAPVDGLAATEAASTVPRHRPDLVAPVAFALTAPAEGPSASG